MPPNKTTRDISLMKSCKRMDEVEYISSGGEDEKEDDEES